MYPQRTPYPRPGSQRLSGGGSDCGETPRIFCAFPSQDPVLFNTEIELGSIYYIDLYVHVLWISDTFMFLRVLRIFEFRWSPMIPHYIPCFCSMPMAHGETRPIRMSWHQAIGALWPWQSPHSAQSLLERSLQWQEIHGEIHWSHVGVMIWMGHLLIFEKDSLYRIWHHLNAPDRTFWALQRVEQWKWKAHRQKCFEFPARCFARTLA